MLDWVHELKGAFGRALWWVSGLTVPGVPDASAVKPVSCFFPWLAIRWECENPLSSQRPTQVDMKYCNLCVILIQLK